MHPPVLNFWGHLTTRNLWLSVGVALLGLAFLIDASLRVYEMVVGMPVYFVPPGGPGVSRPGVIPDGSATDYAARWFQERYTFTPETIDQVHTALKANLHPSLSVAWEVQRKEEAKAIKQAKMSSQGTVYHSQVLLPREDTRVTVQVTGIQTIMIGQERVDQVTPTLTLVLVPWVSSGTPVGLRPIRVTESSPITFLKR
jgi:hypothetical protein